MAAAIFRKSGGGWIDQINRVVRTRPRVEHVLALVNLPHGLTAINVGGRIIDDDVAVFGETDADNQVAGGIRRPAQL
jgi:hypothetical protein